jgi:hypothetical protein
MNDAKKELAALLPQVPWVIVMIDGPKEASQAKMKLNGEDFPAAAIGVRRAIDPGQHTIRAEAAGFSPVEKKFTVAVGTTETVDLVLAPARQGPPPKDGKVTPEQPSSGGLFPHQDAVGIAAIGVGTAGLVMGTVTGVLALGKHSDLEAMGCNETGCPTAQPDAIQSYRTLGTLSTVGFVAGGVGLVAGLVLLVTAPKAPKKAAPDAPKSAGVRVSPFIGAGELGVFGRF